MKLNNNEYVFVELVADLIEIPDDSWSDAIESYMLKSKFHIIVQPNLYREALNIYRALDKSKFSGFGLVDIDTIKSKKLKAKENSLAEEVISDNDFALTYVNFILGDVIKCDSFKDFGVYPKSITKDCFLYSKCVSSRMNPSMYRDKFIGRKSLKKLMEQHTTLLLDLMQQTENLSCELKTIDALKECRPLSEYEIKDIQEKIIEIRTEHALKEELHNLLIQRKNTDTYLVEFYENKLANLSEIESEVSSKLNSTSSKLIASNIEYTDATSHLKTANESLDTVLKQIHTSFELSYIEDNLNILEEEILKKRGIKSQKAIFEETNNELEEAKHNKFNIVLSARATLINEGLDLGYNNENNNRYEAKLIELRDNLLPKYEDNIRKEKEKAFQQFKTDLLYRLSDAIKKCRRQISDINKVLKSNVFGEVKYRFEISAKNKYKGFYQMLTDTLLEDNSPLQNAEFINKYEDNINLLFDNIIEKSSDASERNRVQDNIKIFTNYKTYISVDMVEYRADGSTNSVSESFKLGSGGETQNPFYITLLASFYQLYQMDKFTKKDTMRLIILDEAFSKMDKPRIQSSLNLIKHLGFQAIISAPSDKIALIGESADAILHFRTKNKAFTQITQFTNEKEIKAFLEASTGKRNEAI